MWGDLSIVHLVHVAESQGREGDLPDGGGVAGKNMRVL